MIRYLLDTNMCVELIRRRSATVERNLKRHSIESIGISTITLAELQYGVARSSDPPRNALELAYLASSLNVAPFDDHAAAVYGDICAELERVGAPIGPLDTLIASHAIALHATLVTNNEREFKRATGLRVENWMKPS